MTCTPTPLQKRVMELHSHLEMLGGNEVFGTDRKFRRDFVKTGQASFYQRAMSCATPVPCPCPLRGHPGLPALQDRARLAAAGPALPGVRPPGRPDPTGRTVLRTVATDIGVKNIEEFRYRLAPVGAAPHRVRRRRLPGGAAERDLGGPDPAAAGAL